MKLTILMQFLLASVFAGAASAQTVTSDGYARDLSADVVKNPFGLCWRTAQWTEAKAIAECDADAAPKPAKHVEAAPAAVPVRARTQSITLGADASFDTGKADLKPEGQTKLGELAAKLKDVSF